MKTTCLNLILIGSTLAHLSGSNTPAYANEEPIYSKAWLDQRYDWVLFIDLKTLKNYMSYTGSQVSPILDAKISYHVNTRLASNHEDTVLTYEHLWYHSGQPVGLRRFRNLPFKRGWQGAICLSPSNEANTNTGAIANVVVRLLLDVGLKECMLTAALVPPDIVPLIKSDFRRLSFVETEDSSFDDSSAIHLLVSSGDPKVRVFLIYQKAH